MRLFIADDSSILKSRLVEIISDIEGLEIVGEAEDAVQAIREIDNIKPDIVVLYIRMPKGNGIEVLDSLRKKDKVPTIIVFTNYPYLQYRKRCLDAGADFFFYKALDFEKLIKLLRKLSRSK